jgi:hypothetical protein
MIDIFLLAIIAVIAWCLSGEGAYAACMSLINVIISGLLAMNFFEPLAGFLASNISQSSDGRWDMIALVGLFIVFVTLFRLATDQLIVTYIQVHPLLHQIGSWGGGVLTGYVTMAFLLTALHTAPLPKDYWGLFYAERERRSGPLSNFGPDYQWLGFTQHVTEKSFAKTLLVNAGQDNFVMTRMFDGRNGWLWNIPAKKDTDPPYDVMPSFPIRYATRREQLGGGPPTGTASGGRTPKRPKKRPSGGSRRPGGGF